ncbi:MAG: hypothetical protein WAX07_07210 [Candidatus Altiarchaeia archaeon]
MDTKKAKRMRKLSAIALKKNNRGSLSEEALKLILYSVLLLMVIGIIMGAIGDVGTSVKNAQKAGNEIIKKNSQALTKDADPNAETKESDLALDEGDLKG